MDDVRKGFGRPCSARTAFDRIKSLPVRQLDRPLLCMSDPFDFAHTAGLLGIINNKMQHNRSDKFLSFILSCRCYLNLNYGLTTTGSLDFPGLEYIALKPHDAVS